ncbi:MAG: hypothetical protein QOJ61_2070, partial [Mycobacterium sp.]|nr:hypothetical protein [Mycobacterium sp.]
QTNLQRLQHHRFILGVNPHYRTGLAEQEALVVIAPREPTNRNALMVLPFERYAATAVLPSFRMSDDRERHFTERGRQDVLTA